MQPEWAISVVAVLFGLVSLFTMGWMFKNLFALMKREPISLNPVNWFSQAREVLLKPFLFFMATGLLLMICMLAFFA